MQMIAVILTDLPISISAERVRDSITASQTVGDHLEHLYIRECPDGLQVVAFTTHLDHAEAAAAVEQLLRRSLAACTLDQYPATWRLRLHHRP